jgi:hypothetical protein
MAYYFLASASLRCGLAKASGSNEKVEKGRIMKINRRTATGSSNELDRQHENFSLLKSGAIMINGIQVAHNYGINTA